MNRCTCIHEHMRHRCIDKYECMNRCGIYEQMRMHLLVDSCIHVWSLVWRFGGLEGLLFGSGHLHPEGSEASAHSAPHLKHAADYIVQTKRKDTSRMGGTSGASGGIRRGVWQKKLKHVVCPEKWVLPMGGC